LVEDYLSSSTNVKRANEVKKRIGYLKHHIEQADSRIRRIHEGFESDPPIYTAREAEERIRVIRAFISMTEKEKRRLESVIEQQDADYHTIEKIRSRLEEIRQENLENASIKDKQELPAKLGIVAYPSEDHKTVRISSKLSIFSDDISPQIISIASPKL
jgi:hypothetical protein